MDITIQSLKTNGIKICLQPKLDFVHAGLDVETSTICIAVLWFWLDGILLGFLLLSFTFISLLGFSSGLDNQQCAACTKPCS